MWVWFIGTGLIPTIKTAGVGHWVCVNHEILRTTVKDKRGKNYIDGGGHGTVKAHLVFIITACRRKTFAVFYSNTWNLQLNREPTVGFRKTNLLNNYIWGLESFKHKYVGPSGDPKTGVYVKSMQKR